MIKKVVTLLVFGYSLLNAEWTDKITLNGYFSFEYEDRIGGEEHWRSDEFSSFDSDMLDLIVNVQATERLRVAIDFTWEHGTQTEVDKGNVGYEYGFAEYTIADAFKIRAGKMFTPFGIYNEIHTAKPSTIIFKEPNPTNKMYFISSDKYEQTLLYPRWGTGLAVLGNVQMAKMPLDYIVQMTNGDISYGVDANEYDHDDNDYKAVTARVRLDVTNNLQIGASVHYDTMTLYEKQYESKSVTDTDGNPQTYVEKVYNPVGLMEVNSQGLQLIWHMTDDLRLEAEYMTGVLNVFDITTFRRSGYSILPSYNMMDRVTLYYLFAQADPNHSKSDDSVTNQALGLNIEIDSNMFVKTELYHVDSQDQNTLFSGISYTEVRAALAIGF